MSRSQPLRILLAALGGEGGGVLMNWIVEAARLAGHKVQATSVPGVAQRTGSTSYYIEVAPLNHPETVLSLVPMPGRVDVVVSSELLETARVMAAGFVSPQRTTLISSTARFYATAEKISMGDGRYSEENIRNTAREMAKSAHLLDLAELATRHRTFVSATMFGALAGSDVLPWENDLSRSVLGDKRSEAGFDAACSSVRGQLEDIDTPTQQARDDQRSRAHLPADLRGLPAGLADVVALGYERTVDHQDTRYGQEFLARIRRLVAAAPTEDHRAEQALTEAARRLALWMAYEDVARVADLKTRPERFEKIREEIQLEPGQTVVITEYMKPRAEEIADIMPRAIGERIMRRVERGGSFPLLGRGINVRSNGILGYRLLRTVAALRHIRRRSYRFHHEQAAIEEWLDLMEQSLPRDLGFAHALGELPRVLKGYSDTLLRGKSAYDRILARIVRPAVQDGAQAANAPRLRDAISAALADDKHIQLSSLLGDAPTKPAVPILRRKSA